MVAFGDSAVTVLRPTNKQKDVIAAINRLSSSGGTSLGQGLFTSLSAIAGKPLTIDESALDSDAGDGGHRLLRLVHDRAALGRREHDATRPAEVAEVASAAGVRVHTIGLGTEQGTVVQIDGFSVATALDADLLKRIAKVTDGTYHEAADADALDRDLQVDRPRVQACQEATRGDRSFAAAGGLLLALGAALSIVWFGRVV